MKKIKIGMMLSILSIVLVGCSSMSKVPFDKTDQTIKEDLVGSTINMLTIEDEMIREFKVVDKVTKDDTTEVLGEFQIEYIDEGAGALNKDLKKNDIVHRIEASCILNYKKFEKEWRFSDVGSYKELSHKTVEIENLIERIPFMKKDEDVLADLTDKNIGIQIVGDHVHTVTFGVNDVLGYKQITNVNKFEVMDFEAQENNDLITNVKIYMDVDYVVENSIYQDNGTYNAKGTFTLPYKLIQDKDSSSTWEIQTVKNLESKFDVTKIK